MTIAPWSLTVEYKYEWSMTGAFGQIFGHECVLSQEIRESGPILRILPVKSENRGN